MPSYRIRRCDFSRSAALYQRIPPHHTLVFYKERGRIPLALTLPRGRQTTVSSLSLTQRSTKSLALFDTGVSNRHLILIPLFKSA